MFIKCKGFGLIFLLWAGALLVACEHSATGPTEEVSNVEMVEKETVENPYGGLPPVYESFDELAYLFEQQNDTTYVINFWATWCAPCVKELPYFEELTAKYANRKVAVKLVSLDFKKQLRQKLTSFLAERNLQSEVFVLLDSDANSWVDRVNPEWSGAIPATVVYRGKQSAFYEQSFENLAELEAVVTPLLP